MNDAIKTQLSAFVDGELSENEADLLLRRMGQDIELRQDVAEYLAIGRLMRAEPGPAAADRLHERVAAEIDERPADEEESVDIATAKRAIRPLAGLAIAASVALVAIFSLQQTGGVDEVSSENPVPMVSDMARNGVPSIDAQQERQRQYFLNHAETSSQLGANGMNSRVVTLRFSEELAEEPGAEEAASQTDEADDTDALSAQP